MVGRVRSSRTPRHSIALALFVYWPFRIAVYGINLFRTGGPDGHGAGEVTAFIFYGFAIWALVLFVIGVRTVHGWTWARSVAGVALTAAFAAALALVVGVLYAL